MGRSWYCQLIEYCVCLVHEGNANQNSQGKPARDRMQRKVKKLPGSDRKSTTEIDFRP